MPKRVLVVALALLLGLFAHDLGAQIINRFAASGIVGTVAVANGGTGTASYTSGDVLQASASAALSKIACATAGTLFTGGTPGSCTANPSVTSVTAKGGASTQTFKAGGRLCDTLAANCSAVAYSDASVQNQWNVMSLTIPASVLNATGDALVVHIAAKTAANANTKNFQAYWNGGTCSGSGASCCASGTQLYSDASTGSGVAFSSTHTVKKSGSAAQILDGQSYAGAATIASADYTTGSATESGTIPVAFCARNTSAAATTLQGTPLMEIDYKGQ